jgi:(p)ppGpp synthase/HD superfamily hydrolase
MFKIGSIASGMGMHLHGLKKIGGVPVWAIECDEAIAALLHDAIEDIQVHPALIDQKFGCFVLGFVQELTEDKSLPKPERKAAYKGNAENP